MKNQDEALDTIVATLRAIPGCEHAVEAELQALVNATNSEPGVRFYSVVRLSERVGEYQVFERYMDVSAMQEHLASEHLQAVMGRCAPLLVESPIITKGTTLASL